MRRHQRPRTPMPTSHPAVGRPRIAALRVKKGRTRVVAHQQWNKAPEMVIDTNKTYRATLETSAGNIEVEFYPKGGSDNSQ